MNAIKSAEKPRVPNTSFILPSIFFVATKIFDCPFIVTKILIYSCLNEIRAKKITP